MWSLLGLLHSCKDFRIRLSVLKTREIKKPTKQKALSAACPWVLFGAVLKAWIDFERVGILAASRNQGMSERSLVPLGTAIGLTVSRLCLPFIAQVLMLLKVDLFVVV